MASSRGHYRQGPIARRHVVGSGVSAHVAEGEDHAEGEGAAAAAAASCSSEQIKEKELQPPREAQLQQEEKQLSPD